MQFIKFCLAGALNTSLNLLTMHAFLKLNSHILLSSAIGFIVGAISGYIFNYYFTFNSRKNFFNKLIFYFLLQILLLVLTILIVYFAYNFFGYNPLISQLFAIIITTLINFSVSRKFVFN